MMTLHKYICIPYLSTVELSSAMRISVRLRRGWICGATIFGELRWITPDRINRGDLSAFSLFVSTTSGQVYTYTKTIVMRR
jgi:hypothetical protein